MHTSTLSRRDDDTAGVVIDRAHRAHLHLDQVHAALRQHLAADDAARVATEVVLRAVGRAEDGIAGALTTTTVMAAAATRIGVPTLTVGTTEAAPDEAHRVLARAVARTGLLPRTTTAPPSPAIPWLVAAMVALGALLALAVAVQHYARGGSGDAPIVAAVPFDGPLTPAEGEVESDDGGRVIEVTDSGADGDGTEGTGEQGQDEAPRTRADEPAAAAPDEGEEADGGDETEPDEASQDAMSDDEQRDEESASPLEAVIPLPTGP